MLAAAAFLLAGAATVSPERQLLDAFRAPCERIEQLDAAGTAAVAAGWQRVEGEADPRVERLLKMGRDAIGSDGKMSGSSYRRSHDGRDLFLVLSRYEDTDGSWGNGCRLYDFDAPKAIESASLEAWMGRKPTGVGATAIGSRQSWQPGWGKVTVEVNYVPAGTEGARRFGLSGNVLVAQAIGGF